MAIYGSSLFFLGILACQLCLSAKKRNIGRCRHAAAGHDLPLPGCQNGDPRGLPHGPTGKAIRRPY